MHRVRPLPFLEVVSRPPEVRDVPLPSVNSSKLTISDEWAMNTTKAMEEIGKPIRP